MKIAKKVLAVVMAVAMIAALSAMAFAADSKLELKVSDVVDGVITVELVAKNAEGLETVETTLVYDAAVLAVKGTVKNGPIVNAYAEAFGETVLAGINSKEAGQVIVGVAFPEHIYSNDEYNKAVADNEVENAAAIDTAEIVVCTVKFTVTDTAAATTTIKLVDANGADVFTKDVALKTVEVPTTQITPVTTEKETNPSTGDEPSTGDNMALAAAAGVVVLAGAAFIISKKRK